MPATRYVANISAKTSPVFKAAATETCRKLTTPMSQ